MKRNIRSLIIICALIAGIQVQVRGQGHDFELSRNMETFHDIVRELDLFYVDTINPQTLINRGINAMLSGIDPYTQFFPESDQNDLKIMTTGKYAGIGAIIRQYNGRDWICIEEPYENMPAARYGLRAGDQILRIDGESMKGKPSSYVSDKLRGETDTRLTVTVRRPGVEDSVNVDIVRSVIALPAVPYYGMWNGYGYILLDQFTENCSKEVLGALVNLKERGAKGIILDLRGNGGGLLNEAIDIVGMFVPKGTKVLETRGKIPQSERT
ncbi:MAG: PDZ domain-containing protein, partial [Bacteroidaceae bacterium]|nr:PDZ domain-containing protein [Bacteroidaceae bacterium]